MGTCPCFIRLLSKISSLDTRLLGFSSLFSVWFRARGLRHGPRPTVTVNYCFAPWIPLALFRLFRREDIHHASHHSFPFWYRQKHLL